MSKSMSVSLVTGAVVLAATGAMMSGAQAVPVPGGTLDPLTIPKYVTPLVIPPVMNNSGNANQYDIAVRQFRQQILPGGLWANPAVSPACAANPACIMPPTTVWSYGPEAESRTAVAGLVAPSPASQFNYPAYTVENEVGATTTVNWVNDLIDPATGNFRPHLLPIDRSLHWANPEQLPCMDPNKTKDCRPDPLANGLILQQPYLGPVPIVTHVHGAHVGPESDGYPEAWWLPNANNIPATTYATTGTLANQYGSTNTANGVGSFSYPNDQPSTTLWYHDHTLGMTRNNVYAGPAGFWLIREPGGGETGLAPGNILPGPAPAPGDDVLELNAPLLVPDTQDVRSGIREIPIVIQDRSFNADGSLFYPNNRAFFEGIAPNQLKIPFVGDPKYPSDIAPIWNPEAFFNTMVVNGVTWPVLEVAPALYRFRLLNGCNSRFLNLALFRLNPDGTLDGEQTFWQIGAEQSLLPEVVEIRTGYKNGPIASTYEALLMGLAERADVIVDFRGMANGDRVRMVNTAPDAPFGGFPDIPADPQTTGQVMEFVVNTDLLGKSPTDPVLVINGTTTPNPNAATDPSQLAMTLPDQADAIAPSTMTRPLALIEEESALVCVTVSPNGQVNFDRSATPDPLNPGQCISTKNGKLAKSIPFAPKAAVLGVNGNSGAPNPTFWADLIQTNPEFEATETWELYNHTVDGHPIHLHLVKFKVVDRQAFDAVTGQVVGSPRDPMPTEAGWKDTVIAYPGEVTRVKATFDIEGLYVWHCHIVEHEDNEMMVPYCVGDPATAPGCSVAGVEPPPPAP